MEERVEERVEEEEDERILTVPSFVSQCDLIGWTNMNSSLQNALMM